MLGMDQSNLAKSLKGNYTIGLLRKIATVLGVELHELFEPGSTRTSEISGFLETEDHAIHKINNFQDLEKIYFKMVEYTKSDITTTNFGEI